MRWKLWLLGLCIVLYVSFAFGRVIDVDVRNDFTAVPLPPEFLRNAREQRVRGHRQEESEWRESELAARILPGSLVPSFTVPVLTEGGSVGKSWQYEPTFDNSNAPLFVQAYSRDDAFLQTMWEVDFYLRDLFLETPTNCEYLFLSHERDALATASYLYLRLQTAMEQLTLNSTAAADWNSRFHIATVSVAQLTDSFIPELLLQWPTVITQAFLRPSADVYDEHETMKRLDGRWPWLQAMTSLLGDEDTYSIGWFSDGCTNSSIALPSAMNVTERIALIARDSDQCSFEEKIRNAEMAHAIGVIVYSDEGQPLIDMNCVDCVFYPSIPAAMITFQDGKGIAESLLAGEPRTFQFKDPRLDGSYFLIDSTCALQEVGSMMYPSWKFAAWPLQYLNHIHNVIEVASSQSTEEIVIFDSAHMNGPVNTTVAMIPFETLQRYGTAYLEATLDCYGPTDNSCPDWDRTLQLLVCCEESSQLCGQELGRWITPFKRRIGHWLTPVHSILPLLESSTGFCNFTVTINSNGGGHYDKWVPSVRLHLFDFDSATANTPISSIPLFEGGTWNETYNAREPIEFTVPEGSTSAVLVAVITGHGCDFPDCCAEFCVTSHEFTFNNDTAEALIRTFDNAGTPEGCARRAFMGVEPNEYGTWLYGRNGWCDGQEVIPWEWDVTDQLIPGTNQVLYQGYFEGSTPDPISSPGYIIMHSYLTFFAAPRK